MFCRECGREVIINDNQSRQICLNCGAPVNSVQIKEPVVIKKEKNIIAILACGTFLLATFLPYCIITVFGVPIPMALMGTPDGYMLLGAMLISFVGALLGQNKAVMLGGLLEIGILAYKHFYTYGIINYGSGFWLMVLSSIATIVFGVMGNKRRNI